MNSHNEFTQSDVITKYLSVATDTKIRSSPTRTFSPSDLCFDAGCTVHQQASPKQIIGWVIKTALIFCVISIHLESAKSQNIPWECSCRPTSNASLSFDELVDRHARYWNLICFLLILRSFECDIISDTTAAILWPWTYHITVEMSEENGVSVQ